jgi:hypothetical protein
VREQIVGDGASDEGHAPSVVRATRRPPPAAARG